MKMILATLVFAASTTAFAQAKKMAPPPAKPASTTVAPATSYPTYSAPASSHSDSEITANFGLVAGAINIGGTYVKQMGDFGFGGYLFYQSSKDKNNIPVVSGVTALGALVKVNVYENNSIRAYMAPGLGIAMLKDASISATGSKSDENLISPTFKMGVQYKTAGNLIIGLERMQFTNWLNDSLNNFAGPAEYYTVAASFGF